MVVKAYDFIVENTLTGDKYKAKTPSFIIFTVEDNAGNVYTGVRCLLNFSGKKFLSKKDKENLNYRDNLKIYFKDCKNSEVVFSKTSISVDFYELSLRTLME